MRLCSIDTTLNEKIQPKTITDVIDEEIAQVKINIVKKVGAGLDRKTLEKSHILFITLPTKKLTQNQYIELTSYIDIGGCLILTLPSPTWESLGRFFEELRKELGISFQPNHVYGLPKIPNNVRLIGSDTSPIKAHEIDYNTNPDFMRENGIKKYIPLAHIDDEPIVLAAYKRRGRFIIFSSPEIFDEENSDFLNRLIKLSVRKEDYMFPDNEEKKQIGKSSFYLLFQHACLDSYLLSLFHYNFMFFQEVINFTSIEDLSILINSTISKQKVEGEFPSLKEIKSSLNKLKIRV